MTPSRLIYATSKLLLKSNDNVFKKSIHKLVKVKNDVVVTAIGVSGCTGMKFCELVLIAEVKIVLDPLLI